MIYFAYGFTGLCIVLMVYTMIKTILNRKNDE